VTSVWFNGVRQNAHNQTREEATVQDDTTTRLEAVSVDETKLKAHAEQIGSIGLTRFAGAGSEARLPPPSPDLGFSMR